jgi:dipeptidyl aminopeptidase/acylaminoacyl peptidase
LPGDKYPAYELVLFDVAAKKPMRPEVEKIDFDFPRVRWNKDGQAFTYQKIDRGHQRFRLIEVDAHTAKPRTLIDEMTDTFIWTAHFDGMRVNKVTFLNKTDEIIFVSERDGWRHLYLVDAKTGETKNTITNGEYVVRDVERIDEEKRQVWFRASGRNADQDPYFLHYYRVDFDGTNLVALTDGDGAHTAKFSPDGKYLVDTYSRVDMAPVHELRRASEGKLVCELERADVEEMKSNGWTAPEVFVAKGRDGKTDIWGIIARPRDLDPQKKYPVIESIYAGPHGAHVPKSFSPFRRFSNLTDLGFIVVQMDGMGTAHPERRRVSGPDSLAPGGREEVPVLRSHASWNLRHVGRRAERGRGGAVPPRFLQGRRRFVRLPRQSHGQGVLE